MTKRKRTLTLSFLHFSPNLKINKLHHTIWETHVHNLTSHNQPTHDTIRKPLKQPNTNKHKTLQLGIVFRLQNIAFNVYQFPKLLQLDSLFFSFPKNTVLFFISFSFSITSWLSLRNKSSVRSTYCSLYSSPNTRCLSLYVLFIEDCISFIFIF